MKIFVAFTVSLFMLIGLSQASTFLRQKQIELDVRVLLESEPTRNVKLELLDENGAIIKSAMINSSRSWIVALELGCHYTLRFTKEGYIKKQITIETPSIAMGKGKITYYADVELFKLPNEANERFITIARLKYNPIAKTFTADGNHEADMRTYVAALKKAANAQAKP